MISFYVIQLKFMGDFDKKYVIKEAENILDELNRKDKEEKKQILKLKKDFRKVKRVNIALKVIVGVMSISLIMLIV